MAALAPRLRLAVRAVPKLTRASSSLPAGSSRDPAHPHLHYHVTPPPPSAPSRIALSFLARPPVDGSRTPLGWLPAISDAGLNDFVENPGFRSVLHAALKDGLAKGVSETVAYEAKTRPGDGYMHITDERAVPPHGRIGETEDLIASVFVQDGKIMPETYEPHPSYRLVTTEGVMLLPRGLDEHLLAVLEQVDGEEQAGVAGGAKTAAQ